MAAGTASPVAVLRDADLRSAPQDEVADVSQLRRWSDCAWLTSERSCGSDGAAEDRLADRGGEQVVEIDVQLRQRTDIASAVTIDRNDRLEPDLEVIADVDHAGIDGAGRPQSGAGEIRGRRLERSLDDRNEAIDEIRQREVIYRRFEIRHAVLQRQTPVEELRVKLDAGIAGVRIEGEGAGAAGNPVADDAGQRDRARPPHRVGQVAEAFAEKERRRVGRKLVGADA